MDSNQIDQLVSMMTTLGVNASGVSLTEAQQIVATARASSSQVPPTIATRPPLEDLDDIPLTLLDHQPTGVFVEESTDTARAATAIAQPLPLPPTLPMFIQEGEQEQAHGEQAPQDTVTEATGSTSVAKAPPAGVTVPRHALCARRRRPLQRASATGSRDPWTDVPSVPVRRAHDDDTVMSDTANTAQRQRASVEGSYYTRQQSEQPTWHSRQEDQGCTSYTRLTWQRETCETQAHWQQHPLWRMCGVCLEWHAAEFWIWNRVCSRCGIPLCTIHATEVNQPTYIREGQVAHDAESTFYCGATIRLYCPSCLQEALRVIGDQTGLRHEQRVTTRSLPEPQDPAWDGY